MLLGAISHKTNNIDVFKEKEKAIRKWSIPLLIEDAKFILMRAVYLYWVTGITSKMLRILKCNGSSCFKT